MSRLVRLVSLGTLAATVVVIAGLTLAGKLPVMKKPVDQVLAATAPAANLGAAVSVETVLMADFAETLQVSGTLVPRDEILVGPEIEGLRIIEILVDEGDRVTKDQVLARLVSDVLEAQVAANTAGLAKADAGIAQARSNVTSAEAKLVEAKNAYDRGKPLRQSGYLSEALLDQRESAYKSAQATVAATKDAQKLAEADKSQVQAQRRELDWRRSRTDMRAPTDGVISRRTARVGGFAAGAGDSLFRIIARGEIEMEAEVPETRISQIRERQPVAMEISGAPGLIGKVRLVPAEIDKATRLGRIRVSLGTDPALRIGAFARGTITTETARGLSIPSSAILYADGAPTVQVVKDGRIEVRKLTLGLTANGRNEVRAGLSEHDLVVTKAGTFLRSGDQVRGVLKSTVDAATKAAAIVKVGEPKNDGVKP